MRGARRSLERDRRRPSVCLSLCLSWSRRGRKMAGPEGTGAEATGEMRSLALTPTWSVATVLTLLVASSLIIEHSIHRLSSWLKKTHRNPLYKAMEKMKEEMMMLGFISLLLAGTSRIISGICIDSKFYNSKFSPCSEKEVKESMSAEHSLACKHNHIVDAILHHSLRRNLKALHFPTCPQGYECLFHMKVWSSCTASYLSWR